MQYALTFAVEFVAVSGIALYACLFASGLVSRQAVSAPACELIPDVLIDTDELVAEMARISDEVRSCWVAEAIEVPNFIEIETLEDITLESLGEFIVSDVEVAEAIEWQPTSVDSVVSFQRRVPDLSGMSIRQLKAIAKQVKLSKYSNNTSAVLRERLSGLPAWKLQEALAA